MSYRLKRFGWRLLYLPDARITRYGSASLSTLGRCEKAELYFASALLFFKGHSSTPKYLFARAFPLVAFLARLPTSFLYKALMAKQGLAEALDSVHSSARVLLMLVRGQLAP